LQCVKKSSRITGRQERKGSGGSECVKMKMKQDSCVVKMEEERKRKQQNWKIESRARVPFSKNNCLYGDECKESDNSSSNIGLIKGDCTLKKSAKNGEKCCFQRP
jgi:hypothetical protein